MANGIRAGETCGFKKGRSSKFREGSRVRQTPEEGRRTYQPKRCGNNNEDNSPKNLNNKKHFLNFLSFENWGFKNLIFLIYSLMDVIILKMCLLFKNFVEIHLF